MRRDMHNLIFYFLMVIFFTSCWVKSHQNVNIPEPNTQKPDTSTMIPDATTSTPQSKTGSKNPSENNSSATSSPASLEDQLPPLNAKIPEEIEIKLPFDLTKSTFYAGVHEARDSFIKIKKPGDTILVIYNQGSSGFLPDECFPYSINSHPYDLLQQLDGMTIGQKEVAVFAFCTPPVSTDYEFRDKSLIIIKDKVIKRTEFLSTLADMLIEAGMPRTQIILMGHSAGAWISLLLAAENKNNYGAIIGFNPAFANTYNNRPDYLTKLRTQLVEKIAATRSIKGHIFLIKEDEFERPEDLDFLKKNPNLEIEIISAREDLNCDMTVYGFSEPGHEVIFKSCFQSQYGKVENYLRRLFPAGS